MVSAPSTPPTTSDSSKPAARGPAPAPGPPPPNRCRPPLSKLRSPPLPRPPCSGRLRRPALGPQVDSVDPPVDTVDPPVYTADTPVDTVDPPVDTVDPPVDTVDPPLPRCFRLTSPPSPRRPCSGRRRRPAHAPRVNAVEPPLPASRPIRNHTNHGLYLESARNGCPRTEVSQGLASEGIAKADLGNK